MMKTEKALAKRVEMMKALKDHPKGSGQDAAWEEIVAFSKKHGILDVPISTEGCVHAVIGEDGKIEMVVGPPDDIPDTKPHYGGDDDG